MRHDVIETIQISLEGNIMITTPYEHALSYRELFSCLMNCWVIGDQNHLSDRGSKDQLRSLQVHETGPTLFTVTHSRSGYVVSRFVSRAERGSLDIVFLQKFPI